MECLGNSLGISGVVDCAGGARLERVTAVGRQGSGRHGVNARFSAAGNNLLLIRWQAAVQDVRVSHSYAH